MTEETINQETPENPEFIGHDSGLKIVGIDEQMRSGYLDYAMGVIVAVRFAMTGSAIPSMSLAWLAILVSFGCYLPVVIWADRYPQVGALMLPKACAYVWLLAMCLGI